MKAVGIVAALGAEARALRGVRRLSRRAPALADGANVLVSGIGLDAAAAAARALADAGACALVSWGMAGALDPALASGAVVLPCEVVGDDGRRFATTAEWRERQRAALAARAEAASGALLSRARAIDGIDAKERARRATGAVAVDMESLAIAVVAAQRGLPFLVVRVVVDAAGDALPRSVVAASRGGSLRLWRLAAALLRSPAEIRDLVRLARRYRTARRALAKVAAAGLAVPPA